MILQILVRKYINAHSQSRMFNACLHLYKITPTFTKTSLHKKSTTGISSLDFPNFTYLHFAVHCMFKKRVSQHADTSASLVCFFF